MSLKHTFILILLVALPVLALFGLSWRLIDAEQARTAKQFQDLLQSSLGETDRDLSDYFDGIELDLLELVIDPTDPLAIRELTRSQPLIDQIVILDAEGEILYPNLGALSEQERKFLWKVEQLIADRVFLRQSDNRFDNNYSSNAQRQVYSIDNPSAPQELQQQMAAPNSIAVAPDSNLPQGAFGFEAPDYVAPSRNAANKSMVNIHTREWGPTQQVLLDESQEYGWYTWYFGKGLQLIQWRRLPNETVQLIGLRRARWMADVIAELPDSTPEESGIAASEVQLVDSDGDTVYQWGARIANDEDAIPLASRHLSSPLHPWQLEHFGPVDPIEIGTIATKVNLLAAGGLLSLGLLCLAIYLGREIGRQTREARERVNFVNQVSHELKTPLTNIRMYAELVQQDLDRLDADDERGQSHVSVITSESSRLSRLINNVLTFAGRNHRSSRYRMQVGCIDSVVHSVLDQFRPSLDDLGFEVVLDLDADQQVELDIDATEQMLGNLVSNAEKYAAAGKHLRIRSRHQNGISTIDVADAGPGVPAHFARNVFKPFERASDHINAATGTGIGLSITRSLAQQHGGNLELVDTTIGAIFRLTLGTPLHESKPPT